MNLFYMCIWFLRSKKKENRKNANKTFIHKRVSRVADLFSISFKPYVAGCYVINIIFSINAPGMKIFYRTLFIALKSLYCVECIRSLRILLLQLLFLRSITINLYEHSRFSFLYANNIFDRYFNLTPFPFAFFFLRLF